MADLLRSCKGALEPLVWCPVVEQLDTGRPDRWAHGAHIVRITSAAEQDMVSGREGARSFRRLQELVLSEET